MRVCGAYAEADNQIMDRKPTIVIADDYPELLRLWRITLELDGFRVTAAADGDAALAAVRAETPDVVVLDVRMPAKDGWAVLRQLRGDAGLSHVPVLMLSGLDDVADKARALGAAGLLSKPLCPDELCRAVRDQLGAREPATSGAGIRSVGGIRNGHSRTRCDGNRDTSRGV